MSGDRYEWRPRGADASGGQSFGAAAQQQLEATAARTAPPPSVNTESNCVTPRQAPLYALGGYGACYEQQAPPEDSVVFWLSTEVLQMACEAAPELGDGSLDLDLLPAKTGIFVFERPVHLNFNGNPFHGYRRFGRRSIETSVLTWIPMSGAAVAVSAPDWAPGQTELKEISSVLVDSPAKARPHTPPMALRFMMAAAMLLEHRGVCDVERIEQTTPPPATRKKRKAKKARKPPEVRIVRLRPGTDHAAAYGEGITRQYRHRWMVRGHWRRTVTGTDETGEPIIKRTWIAPYLKGPAGAPMLTTPKVVAVGSPDPLGVSA